VFHFRIPLRPAAAPAGEAEAAGEPPGPAPASFPDGARHLEARLDSARREGADAPLPSAARDLKVLVVDDHAMNRKLLVQYLAGYGIEADTAASAHEALEACAGKAYHVVFMDCHMPGMDGYECTRRLRQGPRPGARPTVIGVTADAMENNLRRCLEAGMDALLVKPIMEKQLRGLLAECAGRVG
jgi:CheY-like chemotaxis protein